MCTICRGLVVHVGMVHLFPFHFMLCLKTAWFQGCMKQRQQLASIPPLFRTQSENRSCKKKAAASGWYTRFTYLRHLAGGKVQPTHRCLISVAAKMLLIQEDCNTAGSSFGHSVDHRLRKGKNKKHLEHFAKKKTIPRFEMNIHIS